MTIEVGVDVRCFYSMRKSKAYAKFGQPAREGDQGKVIRVNNLKDVCIVEIETADGKVHAHIQNLVIKD